MRIEPKQAFYNEDTGAVQPWKDIEVTDAVGNALVAEGLVTEIEGGGGGGGDFTTCTMTVVDTYHGEMQYAYGAFLVNDEIASMVELIDADAYQTILYKGKQTIVVATSGTFAVSGDATADGNYVTATGDFTITIS